MLCTHASIGALAALLERSGPIDNRGGEGGMWAMTGDDNAMTGIDESDSAEVVEMLGGYGG
jgi:hypothetical protein